MGYENMDNLIETIPQKRSCRGWQNASHDDRMILQPEWLQLIYLDPHSGRAGISVRGLRKVGNAKPTWVERIFLLAVES
jgi:hypothetical protein